MARARGGDLVDDLRDNDRGGREGVPVADDRARLAREIAWGLVEHSTAARVDLSETTSECPKLTVTLPSGARFNVTITRARGKPLSRAEEYHRGVITPYCYRGSGR